MFEIVNETQEYGIYFNGNRKGNEACSKLYSNRCWKFLSITFYSYRNKVAIKLQKKTIFCTQQILRG